MLLYDINEGFYARLQQEDKIVMNAKLELRDLEKEIMKHSPRVYYGGRV